SSDLSNTITVPIAANICSAAQPPGAFALSNQAPVCDQNPPAGPAVQLSWSTASGSGVSYHVYRNGAAIGSSTTGTSFYNNAGLAAGSTYTYFVRATSSGGTTHSNTITVPIAANICSAAQPPGAFALSNQARVCDQNPPAGPAVQLSWSTASGSGVSYHVYRNGAAIASTPPASL